MLERDQFCRTPCSTPSIHPASWRRSRTRIGNRSALLGDVSEGVVELGRVDRFAVLVSEQQPDLSPPLAALLYRILILILDRNVS